MNTIFDLITETILQTYDPIETQYRVISNFRKSYNSLLIDLLNSKDNHQQFIDKLISILTLCTYHKSFAFYISKEVQFVKSRIIDFDINYFPFLTALKAFREAFKN